MPSLTRRCTFLLLLQESLGAKSRVPGNGGVPEVKMHIGYCGLGYCSIVTQLCC
jgi:hypothetical protein